MRKDALGFFWTDLPKEPGPRAERVPVNRPMPPIPDTGWKAPREFPRIEAGEIIGIDTETKDLELLTKGPGFRRGAHLVGVSIAVTDASWYFPMRHEVAPEQNLAPDNVLRWLRDTLGQPGLKVGANLGYDLDALESENVKVAGPFYDVQIAEPLLNENRFTFELEALGIDYVQRGKTDEALSAWVREAYGASNYRQEIWRSPPCLVGPYAEGDANLPLLIRELQLVKLAAEGLLDLCDMEHRLIPMLLAMRQRGVRVNIARAEEMHERLKNEIKEKKARLDELGGCEINFNAADSIANAFDNLGIAYPLTAKTKKPSFTKEWLLHHPSEIAHAITELRTLDKFRSTFVEGYILEGHVNGRIHCQFNQLKSSTDDPSSKKRGTVSGRFSSSNPNLQNIPARDSVWGPLIRSLFEPEDGEDWTKFDWSQIEFRMVAHYGRGESAERVRELYRNDPETDFHLMVSELCWPGEAERYRKPAKNINFGLVYGMGIKLLAAQIGIPLEEAEKIFAQYHLRLPFVRELAKLVAETASEKGYITTLMGRRRRFDLWEPRWSGKRFDEEDDEEGEEEAAPKRRALPYDAAVRAFDGRIRRAFTHKALNGLIQGSAADLMKYAMVHYWENFGTCVLGAPMLTVHDELDFSCPRGRAGKRALKDVRDVMENGVKLRVPVIADLEIGANWGSTK